jgi:DNA-binding NarL/FixJ family response regulator
VRRFQSRVKINAERTGPRDGAGREGTVEGTRDLGARQDGTGTCVVCGRPLSAAHEQFRRTHRLTERQLEVVRCAAAGSSSTEIAEHLGLSTRTVEGHLQAAYDKLGVHTRTRLALVFHDLAAGSRSD